MGVKVKDDIDTAIKAAIETICVIICHLLWLYTDNDNGTTDQPLIPIAVSSQ